MICIRLCACAIALLHEQWMCLGMQRNTHITGNNLIFISVPINLVDGSYMYIYRCLQFRSLANCYILPIAYEGELEGRDGYRDQIDVGISLHAFQDTSTVHEVQQWHKHTVLCIITIRACFLCFFYNPYMFLFNSKNVFHLHVSTYFLLV